MGYQHSCAMDNRKMNWMMVGVVVFLVLIYFGLFSLVCQSIIEGTVFRQMLV